jgi:hypothetical protein
MQPGRPLPLERRVMELESLVAQLNDQLWWLSLPFWRRWLYMAFGYRAPIQHFYETHGWWREFVEQDLKPAWRRIRGRS